MEFPGQKKGRKKLESPETRLRLATFSVAWFIMHGIHVNREPRNDEAGRAFEHYVEFMAHLVAHIALGYDPRVNFEERWNEQAQFVLKNSGFVTKYMNRVRSYKGQYEAAAALLATSQSETVVLCVEPEDGSSLPHAMLCIYLAIDKALDRRGSEGRAAD